MGSILGNDAGDMFIAFSTANPADSDTGHLVELTMIPNKLLDPVFAATVEAIVNAMVAAEDMTGIDGHHVRALPQEEPRGAPEVQPPAADAGEALRPPSTSATTRPWSCRMLQEPRR